MKFKAKEIFTIPNILTYIRLLLVPVFIWLMFDKGIADRAGIESLNVYIAFAVFVVASLTDIVDGWVARRFNMMSDIGKVTDPLADKLLQISTLLTLTIVGNVHWAFVVILFVKELYMVVGAAVILKGFKSNFVVESNVWGKVGSVINTVGIILAFFHEPKFKNLYYIDWVIIGIGCVFAIIAAAEYTSAFIKYYKTERVAANSLDELDSSNGNNDTQHKDS